MRALSIKTRLSLAVGAVFIVLAAGEAFFALRYFEAAYRKSAAHDLLLMGATLAESIDSRLAIAESALEAAKAALPPAALADRALAQTFLDERVTLQSIFPKDILLIAADGRLIARHPARPGASTPTFADQAFVAAVKARKGPHLAAIPGRTGTGAEVFAAVPVISPAGEVVAIMAGIADLALSKATIETLLRKKIGQGAHIYIAARDGRYLLHLGENSRGEEIPPDQVLLFEKALAEGEATGETVDCCSERILAAFLKLPRIDSGLMISWPLALAYAPLETAKGYFFASIVLGTTVLILLAWFLAARIIAPLETMTRHVRALPHLPAGRRLLKLDRGDEIGILAKSFDELMITLEDRQAELVRLNNDLECRATELAVKNRELETFSYSLSHDLKNPLTTITLSAEVLRDAPACGGDANAATLLSTILAESARMNDLIDAMLSLSRVSLAQIHYEAVNLSALARETLARLSAESPGRRAEWTIAPDVMVQGDRRLLLSVMENLLGNAWKYSAKNEVTRIEFGVKAEGEQTCFVRDNGVGFDMAKAAHLFEPFQRLHADRDFTGFGIGLATVQRIIQRHGGRLWAEAEPNQGATFYFTLPPVAVGAAPPASRP